VAISLSLTGSPIHPLPSRCSQEVRAAESEGHRTVPCGTGLSRVAPDCPVPQEDKASNCRPAPNPNGWVTWRRTGQGTVPIRWRTGLSGAPIASSLPTATKVAINTPNHHNLWHPSFSEITFNTRASAFTTRHISKDQTLSKPRVQLKHLVTCERVCSCSFALLFLGLPFFFFILVLK
jgi:hypothetical protein